MSETEVECGCPCDPRKGCDECAEYWSRMRREGFWIDDLNAKNSEKGWTQKALREWSKVI